MPNGERGSMQNYGAGKQAIVEKDFRVGDVKVLITAILPETRSMILPRFILYGRQSAVKAHAVVDLTFLSLRVLLETLSRISSYVGLVLVGFSYCCVEEHTANLWADWEAPLEISRCKIVQVIVKTGIVDPTN